MTVESASFAPPRTRTQELEHQVHELTKTAEIAQTRVRELERRLDEERQQRQAWAKAAQDRLDEIGRLKDELQRLTITNARLEGWRERVETFDPVSERQRYLDDSPRPRELRVPGLHGAGGFDLRQDYTAAPAALPPWYRRSVA